MTIIKCNNESSVNLGACRIIRIFVTIYSCKVSIRVCTNLKYIRIWIQHYTRFLSMLQLSRYIFQCELMIFIGMKHVSCTAIHSKGYIWTSIIIKVEKHANNVTIYENLTWRFPSASLTKGLCSEGVHFFLHHTTVQS